MNLQGNLGGVMNRGGIQIFCDGSWSWETKEAGYGVIVLEGHVILMAQAGDLPRSASALEAEGNCLWKTMELAQQENLTAVFFLSDSTDAMAEVVLRYSGIGHSHMWATKCREFLNNNKQWKVFHVFRDSNARADMLARKARREELSWSSISAILFELVDPTLCKN